LDDQVAQAICDHKFQPVKNLQWRNSRLQFGSVKRLMATLEDRTDDPWLTRVRESDDLAALKALGADTEVAARATDGPSVKLLWDVCRVPDFRGISKGEHAGLLTQIYNDLHQLGHVSSNWFGLQVRRIDRTDGDIDTLSKRLAYIRTWTYVAQRNGWLVDESHWREETRAVEDRLSDALHGALTQRFVDRRTSILLRRLKQKESLVADVNDKGEVTVEGEFVGRLEGFRFRMDKAGSPDEAKTLRQASVQALVPQFHLLADRFYNAPDPEIDFTEQGGLMWGDQAVGKLTAGPDPFKPGIEVFVDDEAGADVAAKVQRRLQHFIDRKIAAGFEPLLALRNDDALIGTAKGFAFRMAEGFGILPRGDVADEVKALDQDARGALRKHGVRFGQFTIFMPLLLKPAPTRLRLVLWSLFKGLSEFPESPPPGLVTVPAAKDAVAGYYAMAGYRASGERAIRIDMLERLADMLRDKDSRGGFEANPDMLSITGMTLEQFSDLMIGLGYKAEKGEREKVKAVAPEAAAPEAVASTETPAEIPTETPAEVVAPTDEIPAETTLEAPDTGPEMEVFYTFTWGGRAARPARPQSDNRPRAKGKPKGKAKPQGGGNKPQSFQAKPKREKPIDPDNPFAAALAGFKRD
jgi:ATP-dependent RNA helicase SUPV3L1/SUV3